MAHKIFSALAIAAVVALGPAGPVEAQFRDDFDRLELDPTGRNGWRFRTGDGQATMRLTRRVPGVMSIEVDATEDKENIWWALVQREVSEDMDLALLQKPGYAVRIEARIRSSHAPRRVNLQIQTQRTTDYHSHLMEYDIPEAGKWKTISLTTRGLDAKPGDTLIGHMALMDWGLSKYTVDVDYIKADIVKASRTLPDLGEPIPYHPPVADPRTFAHTITLAENLIVGPNQNAILRWDGSAFESVRGSALIELTTDAVEGDGLLRVVEVLPDGSLNPQMIIDWPPAKESGAKTFLTIPRVVLQRLVDGRSKGIALTPLGDLRARFHAARLLFNATPRVRRAR